MDVKQAGQGPALQKQPKLIIAHRGASKEAPENTIKAFEKAIELGADMIELDVRKTRDNILVVIHNTKLNKRKIGKLAYYQINQIDKNIPTLEQVLQLISGKINLDIELKETGFEQEAVKLILKYFKPEEFIITSFKAKVISNIKKIYPDIKLGIIIGHNKIEDNLKLVKMIFGKVSKVADILIINRNVWKYKLPQLYRFGQKPIYVWTVDKEKEIEKLLNDKLVSGIITNDPGLGIKLRKTFNN